jgi:hypothetical protein
VSTDLVILLVAVVVGFVAFAPAVFGDQRVERAGNDFKRAVEAIRGAVVRVGTAVIAVGLVLAFGIVVVVALFFFGENSGLPPGTPEKVINEYVDILLTVLKYTAFVVGGLIGLAAAVGVIVVFLSLVFSLLALVPVTTRSVGATAFVLTVAVAAAGYISARAAKGNCAHQHRPLAYQRINPLPTVSPGHTPAAELDEKLKGVETGLITKSWPVREAAIQEETPHLGMR